MASNGFCPTCAKVVYYSEDEGEAHCPVCSGPLVGQPEELMGDSAPTA